MRRVLGVFAKQPVEGAVKTRLARESTPEWAREVAAAFLGDTLDRAATVQAERIIAFCPAEARAWFETIAAGRFDLQQQVDGDLGRRMEAFFEMQMKRGADQTVIIGADSPTLPVELIERAFTLLESSSAVLGPAQDGGYYLIGFTRRLPPVFAGIEWGSASVFSETVRRVSQLSRLFDDEEWIVAHLPTWYDVDTLADWQTLCGDIAATRRAGIDPGVPRTEVLTARPIGARPPNESTL